MRVERYKTGIHLNYMPDWAVRSDRDTPPQCGLYIVYEFQDSRGTYFATWSYWNGHGFHARAKDLKEAAQRYNKSSMYGSQARYDPRSYVPVDVALQTNEPKFNRGRTLLLCTSAP